MARFCKKSVYNPTKRQNKSQSSKRAKQKVFRNGELNPGLPGTIVSDDLMRAGYTSHYIVQLSMVTVLLC
ncbi:hypothetical protein P153DRAFT_370278 [Dothidotthia symphoricarpi CBS 119687]|uniref:Uncharacterized protein n=1 Tax=Dothidotthia symphoricarpi CBS 119687 TaxID=1392245 RepID=A0A6A5ZZF7_9PLEO|nr:uncharacterized protein P153DRAFT_370278 [Dothidotthia symphoricarpi CBS 119687]KAF2124949.1 hypothetical protein P153DRAFT_370278 [Dothidotthia symphoricarpi CBS 119687]